MVVTFTKMRYSDIPEVVRNAVMSYSGTEVTIDETKLTQAQQSKVREYLEQNGYKLQA